LRHRTPVGRLFDEGHSLMAFPLRAVYRLRQPGEHPVQFLITIPKRRVRKAVRRVLLRRRVREAYRLHRRQLLTASLDQCGLGVDVAFIYLDSAIAPYGIIEQRMTALLTRIAHAAQQQQQQPSEEGAQS